MFFEEHSNLLKNCDRILDSKTAIGDLDLSNTHLSSPFAGCI